MVHMPTGIGCGWPDDQYTNNSWPTIDVVCKYSNLRLSSRTTDALCSTFLFDVRGEVAEDGSSVISGRPKKILNNENG